MLPEGTIAPDFTLTGLAKRTLYVLDADRTITYAWQSDDSYVDSKRGEATNALVATAGA